MNAVITAIRAVPPSERLYALAYTVLAPLAFAAIYIILP